jgi:chorismate mutase
MTLTNSKDRNTERDAPMMTRGVRGATVVDENSPDAIRTAIRELVAEIVERNGIDPDDLGAAMFTTTPDLDASFPAEAIRHMGWEYVPMLGAVEMAKPGAPLRCLRVLLLWNTTLGPRDIRHVYLRGTEVLRTAGRSEAEEAG